MLCMRGAIIIWCPYPILRRTKSKKTTEMTNNCSFPSQLEPFWLTMTPLPESFNPSKFTPLYKNKQHDSKILQWRLLVQHFWSLFSSGESTSQWLNFNLHGKKFLKMLLCGKDGCYYMMINRWKERKKND